ncbi:MAG: CRISPR-associated protein Cas4 [Polyangiaceae bacterium]|nr:CRISPR-associated protein Cas4 [Polyangiaceae bacterium]
MSGASSEADNSVVLSALQHVVFCERQAALIHVERVWQDNASTAEGNLLHGNADLPGNEKRRNVEVARAVLLRCDALGISGRADVVEYHMDPTVPGGKQPYPVEYKRGKVKNELADKVQLCAQAFCLEEMHGMAVPRGALFYGQSHRRVDVEFDTALRERTKTAIKRMRELIETNMVPPAEPAPKCRSCSLEPLCLPNVTNRRTNASEYLVQLMHREDKL